jgi:hypothetical protein
MRQDADEYMGLKEAAHTTVISNHTSRNTSLAV